MKFSDILPLWGILFCLALLVFRVAARLLDGDTTLRRYLWIGCFLLLLLPWLLLLLAMPTKSYLVAVPILVLAYSVPIQIALVVSPVIGFLDKQTNRIAWLAKINQQIDLLLFVLTRKLRSSFQGDLSTPQQCSKKAITIFLAYALVICVPIIFFQIYFYLKVGTTTIVLDLWLSDMGHADSQKVVPLVLTITLYSLLTMAAFGGVLFYFGLAKQFYSNHECESTILARIASGLKVVSILTFVAVILGIISLFFGSQLNPSQLRPIPILLFATRNFGEDSADIITSHPKILFMQYTFLTLLGIKAWQVANGIGSKIPNNSNAII